MTTFQKMESQYKVHHLTVQLLAALNSELPPETFVEELCRSNSSFVVSQVKIMKVYHHHLKRRKMFRRLAINCCDTWYDVFGMIHITFLQCLHHPTFQASVHTAKNKLTKNVQEKSLDPAEFRKTYMSLKTKQLFELDPYTYFLGKVSHVVLGSTPDFCI